MQASGGGGGVPLWEVLSRHGGRLYPCAVCRGGAEVYLVEAARGHRKPIPAGLHRILVTGPAQYRLGWGQGHCGPGWPGGYSAGPSWEMPGGQAGACGRRKPRSDGEVRKWGEGDPHASVRGRR